MTDVKDIKVARPQDIPQIVALGYKSFDDNELQDFGAAPDFLKTMEVITSLVIDGVVLVIRNEEDDEIVDGVLAMAYDPIWWSNEKMLQTVLYYIKEDKRSYKKAANLLKAGQEYAIMEEVPLVIDLIGNKDTQRKKTLLKRLRFDEFGSFYIFRP